jgi:hypothetical protein
MTFRSADRPSSRAGVRSASRRRRFNILRSLATLPLVTSLGCTTGHSLMPTPNLYARSGGYPESQVPADARTSRVDLLYVTDRAPETVDGSLAYGARRSASAAYGSVTVEFGEPARPLRHETLNFWTMPEDYP